MKKLGEESRKSKAVRFEYGLNTLQLTSLSPSSLRLFFLLPVSNSPSQNSTTSPNFSILNDNGGTDEGNGYTIRFDVSIR